ncbi:MAG TPA: ROK family protein, partial [Candidatus Acidoferrum sp.]|nr:ROK family protein [Candidatus Acidoferrum sp.]
ADLADLSAELRARPAVRDSLIGIGVAVVGVVRRSDGLVAMAPNLDWHDVALGERLAQVFGTDVPISVANDADLGAIAELRRGAAIGGDNVLFISGEVGVGGGLIVDGRPLTGAAGYGGEVGHMPINPNGTACHCGSTGCWETEIGANALLRRAGHRADGSRSEIETVVREAVDGSPVALAAFASVGHWLGFGLAGLINVLNPRLVVLGGLFGRIHPFVITALREELARRAMPATLKLVRVVPASLGMEAPLLGAAELAFEPMLSDPAIRLRQRDAMTELASA